MVKSFSDIERSISRSGVHRTIALAGSHDRDALFSVVNARRKGLTDVILIGREAETRTLLREMDEDQAAYRFVDLGDEADMAGTACRLVSEGEADIPMKGIIQTGVFMRAVLDKRWGFLRENSLISQATLFEYPPGNRLMMLTDCAINIAPDYAAKVKIITNAAALARDLGFEKPKVAVLAPIEAVNPEMQSTIDAAMLSKAAERGQIKGCIVDGPLGFDNAVSIEAALHKGIVSPVAGSADILLAPDLEAGNLLTKSLTYFAGFKTAGTVNGGKIPVVMSSRTDSPQDKYHSIITALYRTL